MKLPKTIGAILGVVLVFLGLVIFGNFIGNSTDNKKSLSQKVPLGIKSELITDQLASANGVVFEEGISKKIAENITDLNADGLTKLDNSQFIKALNPQKLINEILEKEIQDLEVSIAEEFNVKITLNQKKILANPSKSQKEGYLNSFKNILEKNSQAITAENINSPADFYLITAAYEKAAIEFEELNIPADLVEFHKQELTLLYQQKIIWEKLEQAESNPLPAVIALGKYEEAIKEYEALKKAISVYIQTNNLTVKWL